MFTVLLMSAALLAAQESGQTADPAAADIVSVDDYARDYEGPKSDAEHAYDATIASAYAFRVGQMEGSWVVEGKAGNLIAVELRRETSGDLEGAWRSMQGATGINGSGFVSNIALTNNDLELNYMPGRATSPNILHMKRQSDGSWQGTMMDVAGKKVPVTMKRPTVR